MLVRVTNKFLARLWSDSNDQNARSLYSASLWSTFLCDLFTFFSIQLQLKPCPLFKLNEQKLGHAIRLPRLNQPTKATGTKFFRCLIRYHRNYNILKRNYKFQNKTEPGIIIVSSPKKYRQRAFNWNSEIQMTFKLTLEYNRIF